ncbi:MAG: 4-hydroxy-3-methylbut-2-enyl diphosphate reductase [Victivallales bacterium]|nr:4-hydroxy-3-methylbut-2-enyl diphosphate reductase [Victivallales bacterium]
MKNGFFSSELVERVRRNNGVFDCGNGKRILLPKTFGFCSGVFNAVSKLSETVDNNPQKDIRLMGAMIHNPAVNSHFAKSGVHIEDSKRLERVFELPQDQTIFVIPAFGLPIETDERLRSFAASETRIVDATCPFVRRVWEQAKTAGEQGGAVIIHGKFGHQETNAIWSRAVKYAKACALLTSPEDAKRFAADAANVPVERLFNPRLLPSRRWTLINQTTMLSTETAEIAEILKTAAWHTKSIELAGTLCPATRNRQLAAKELCMAGCDCIYVLGGTDSSNTTQLYRMAAENIGEEHCFFVQSSDNIGEDCITHYKPLDCKWIISPIHNGKNIGILTGASCPDSELEKLILKLAR